MLCCGYSRLFFKLLRCLSFAGILRQGKLVDLLDEVEEEDLAPGQVFVSAPAVHEDSGEDPGHEDRGGDIDNVNHNLLITEGELVFDNTDDDEDCPTVSSTKGSSSPSHSWQVKNEKLNLPTGKVEAVIDFRKKTATQIMEYFFHEDFFSLLSAECKRYAAWKGLHIMAPSQEEWKFVLGALFFSGCHPLPSRRHYWSSLPDFEVNFIAKKMSRN